MHGSVRACRNATTSLTVESVAASGWPGERRPRTDLSDGVERASGEVDESLERNTGRSGESLDHRIGAELNPDGRESMFLYAGATGGWLGGPCISFRGAANRRAPLHNPINAYMQMMGIDSDQFATLIARQRSINDLVKSGKVKAPIVIGRESSHRPGVSSPISSGA